MSELVMTATTGMTVEEFLALPEVPGERRELLDGEIHVAASPVRGHQRAVARLLLALHDALVEHGAEVLPAPLDVVLGPRTVVQPDVLVYDAAAVAAMDPDEHPPTEKPCLVVEVLSPSNARFDTISKRRRYARAGIPEFWIVSLEERTIDVLRLVDGEYADVREHEVGDVVTTPLFPDVAVAVADVVG